MHGFVYVLLLYRKMSCTGSALSTVHKGSFSRSRNYSQHSGCCERERERIPSTDEFGDKIYVANDVGKVE
jgi:hypothetical protein